MLQYVNFSTAPMRLGEVRFLSARGAEPLTVEIKCFVSPPIPPSFRSCSACGTVAAKTDEPVRVVADESLFQQGGELRVEVRDNTGDSRQFTVQVIPQPKATMNTDGDPLDFIQKQFQQKFDLAKARMQELQSKSQHRSYLAVVLKVIAVGAGIAVAAGVPGELAQALGICVTIVVALDTVFSNYSWLATLVDAESSYGQLLEDIQTTHTRALPPILALKHTNPVEAKAELVKLLQQLFDDLTDGCKKIEDRMRAAKRRAAEAFKVTESK